VLERPQHSEVKYIQEVGSSIAEALRREWGQSGDSEVACA
jgi:hypothetical protein